MSMYHCDVCEQEFYSSAGLSGHVCKPPQAPTDLQRKLLTEIIRCMALQPAQCEKKQLQLLTAHDAELERRVKSEALEEAANVLSLNESWKGVNIPASQRAASERHLKRAIRALASLSAPQAKEQISGPTEAAKDGDAK